MELREQLLAIEDVVTKEVEPPGWGRPVTIREMGLQESLDLAVVAEDGKVQLTALQMAETIIGCVIDPDTGDPVFLPEDAEALAKKGKSALMYLYNEIMALSGTIEGAEKN